MDLKIYCSTREFGNFIRDFSILKDYPVEILSLIESDSRDSKNFTFLPRKVREILFLDCPDAIITVNNQPILIIEESHEAGTGHNAFQRFPRMVAASEQGIPYIYIYPEAVIIDRENSNIKWDSINPLVFKAMLALREINEMPSLLFYYPSFFRENESNNLEEYLNKGLKIDSDYLGCPDSKDSEIREMFSLVNEYLSLVFERGFSETQRTFNKNPSVRNRINFLYEEFVKKSEGKDWSNMSPLSASYEVKTEVFLKLLKKYQDENYEMGKYLASRDKTIIYVVNAKFRGDPYPGCVSAIDYLKCRNGRTTEDRNANLVMIWGDVSIGENGEVIVKNNEKSTIQDFIESVKATERKNLLSKDYNELKSEEVPRYFLHLLDGTKYTKVKHIRVYSYFLDAILFPDGALWRDS